MGGTVTMFDTPLGAWLLLVWLFMLGSFFGSFANVVIYRLPLGQSLLWPGSHCPTCNHPIRWHDNVPVFGWLMLNGRCRDCRAPISVRYPLVEALFGFMLATLGWLEVIDARANLPNPPFTGVITLAPSDWLLVGYHMLLVYTLVAAALIEHDAQRIPRRLLGFALALGLVLPLGWSVLRPVPLASDLPLSLQVQPALRALLEGVAGAGAGTLLGLLAWPSIAQVMSRKWPGAVVLSLATIGTLLGWQAVCGIAIIAAGFDLLAALVGLTWPATRRMGWVVWIAAATVLWLFCWSTIVQAIPAFGGGQLLLLVAAGAAVAIVSSADWLIRRLPTDRHAASR